MSKQFYPYFIQSLFICESCNFSAFVNASRGVLSSVFSQRKKFCILCIFQCLTHLWILKLILYVNDECQRDQSWNVQVSRGLIKLRLFIILSLTFMHEYHSVSIHGSTFLFTAHPGAQANLHAGLAVVKKEATCDRIKT